MRNLQDKWRGKSMVGTHRQELNTSDLLDTPFVRAIMSSSCMGTAAVQHLEEIPPLGCMLGQWHISSWVWVWVKYNQFQEAFLIAVHAILLFQQFFFQDGNFTTDQFQECYCMKVQIQPGHPKIIQQATITRNRLCLSMPICILEPPVVWNLYRLHIRWRVETSL